MATTAEDRARTSREAQGLPPLITDPSALAQVAALLHREEAADAAA